MKFYQNSIMDVSLPGNPPGFLGKTIKDIALLKIRLTTLKLRSYNYLD